MSFYKDGIKFECKQCGNCCNISGYVFVFKEDLNRILELTDFTMNDLQTSYLSTVDGYTVFRDKGTGACIFWDEAIKGCKIYEARPTQCRTFPFWKTLLYNESKWKEGTSDCAGVGSGRLYSEEEIDELKNKM
ncbi:MAG: YkgJ family cysteine cluster protein [Candidatus Delongbacteria bacterium]|nr:YkgJ family cysteine cluster protein [Candidatus Delongbacteria bacterium]